MTDTTADTVSNLFGTEGLTEETRQLRQALLEEGRVIRANTVEAFDTDLDSATAEVLATRLTAEKDLGDAQLSYALYVLKENKAFLDAGYDTFQEYVENKIHISAPKASALSMRWENFIGLGLSAAALNSDNGIAWNKFGELIPGIKAGVIDDTNIDLWLPMIACGGEHALTNKGIAMLVKADIAATKAEDDPDQIENFTIRVSADDKENILRHINTIEQATGMLSAGDVVRAALESKITEIAENSEDVRKNYGLRRIKEIAERMVEGIQVIFLSSPDMEYSEDAIGVVAYTQVFQSVEDPSRFMLGIDADEAAESLGSEVQAFDLEIAGQTPVEKKIKESVEEPKEKLTFKLVRPNYDELTIKEVHQINKELVKDLIANSVVDVAFIKTMQSKAKIKFAGDPRKLASSICDQLLELSCDNQESVI